MADLWTFCGKMTTYHTYKIITVSHMIPPWAHMITPWAHMITPWAHDPTMSSHDPTMSSHDPTMSSHDPTMSSHVTWGYIRLTWALDSLLGDPPQRVVALGTGSRPVSTPLLKCMLLWFWRSKYNVIRPVAMVSLYTAGSNPRVSTLKFWTAYWKENSPCVFLLQNILFLQKTRQLPSWKSTWNPLHMLQT